MPEDGKTRPNTGRIIEIKGVVMDAVFTEQLPELHFVFFERASDRLPGSGHVRFGDLPGHQLRIVVNQP